MVCIVLAGAMTFRAQGVRPGTWWEAERAARASRTTMLFLTVLLAAVIALIVSQVE